MLDPVVLAQLAELDVQNEAIRMGDSAVGSYIRWRGSAPRVRGSGYKGCASVSDTSPRADTVTDAAATTLGRAVLRGEINYVPTSNAHPFRTQRDHSRTRLRVRPYHVPQCSPGYAEDRHQGTAQIHCNGGADVVEASRMGDATTFIEAVIDMLSLAPSPVRLHGPCL